MTGFAAGTARSSVCIEMALDPPISGDVGRRGWLRVASAHTAIAARGKLTTGEGAFRIGRVTWNRRKPDGTSTLLGIPLRIPRWRGRTCEQRPRIRVLGVFEK